MRKCDNLGNVRTSFSAVRINEKLELKSITDRCRRFFTAFEKSYSKTAMSNSSTVANSSTKMKTDYNLALN